jgi:phosphomannomutase
MKQHMDGQNYQFGIAWDGDADRCCFFDEHGDSIESSYAMALIAEVYLRKKSGQTVVHDSKNSWLISHLATTHGCQAVRSKTGHAHIKKTMHDNKAIYGGESSAHHYFQEMDYADSGVMPWLIMLNLFHEGNFSLQKKVDVMRTTFPILKEINLQCHHLEDMLTHIREYYSNRHVEEETFDGHHFIFKEEGWKFHIRNSNTEPLVRLNIEGKTSKELLLKEAKVLTSLFKDA